MNTASKKIIQKLDSFNEIYTIEKNTIVIKTDSPLYTYVTFTENKYLIEGRLMKWNFLTGFLKMTIESSYKYLTTIISSSIILSISLYLFPVWDKLTIDLKTGFFGLGILIIILSWTVLTFLYLKITYLSKEQKIMSWLD